MDDKITVKILRSRQGHPELDHYDDFIVPVQPGVTVLDILFYIQDQLDDGLVFRYSCRGAVCGSCAMLINKIPRLACKTQVKPLLSEPIRALKAPFGKMLDTIPWDPESNIIIEPLPNFPVVKDLVVDLSSFWEKFNKITPWILGDPSGQAPMTPEKANALAKVANCFLCATCVGSCPINAKSPEYLGPAALAHMWRYVEDPNDQQSKNRLETINTKPEGALGCEYYYNCVKVCPRSVAPAKEIRSLRDKMSSNPD